MPKVMDPDKKKFLIDEFILASAENKILPTGFYWGIQILYNTTAFSDAGYSRVAIYEVGKKHADNSARIDAITDKQIKIYAGIEVAKKTNEVTVNVHNAMVLYPKPVFISMPILAAFLSNCANVRVLVFYEPL